MAGFLTPLHVLLLLAVIAAFFVLGRLTRDDVEEAGAERGRRLRQLLRRPRLRKPTRREVHVGWLVFSLLVAFLCTRAVAVPLFLLVFFAVWIGGYGVLSRLYR